MGAVVNPVGGVGVAINLGAGVVVKTVGIVINPVGVGAAIN